MMHKIKSVRTKDNLIIVAAFFDGTIKEYDVKTLFNTFPQLKELENNPELFHHIQVDVGGYGISWNDELDLDAEAIWEDGVETDNKQDVDIVISLAENLIRARDLVGFTQKQLSEVTGIYQADISKIERGLGNPSLLTLKRLADGLGMKLRIEFVNNLSDLTGADRSDGMDGNTLQDTNCNTSITIKKMAQSQ